MSLPARTTVGAVHLTVADLGRSLDYYRRTIGLAVLAQDGGRASLGVGVRELLALVEEPGARPAPGHTGLFHFALLVPSRRELARWLAHAIRERTPLTGLSDHAVSEAVYLRDPDGHGIEIYADRPRETWEGEVSRLMTTGPLDVEDLLRELDDPRTAAFDGLPAGTTMGHVHLCVSTIPETIAFYRDGVGFDVTAALGSQAVFLAAGGYHHHVGANTWESAGAGPPPEGSAALRHATLVLPSAAERDALVERLADGGRPVEDSPLGPIARDPSGNRLVLAHDAA